jgi:hypothetical protein
MVGRFSPHLLGRHVADCPHHGAGLRRCCDGWRLRLAAFPFGDFRQPEIEDLDAALGGDEDVFGLQIAVDDPLLVRRGEPVRDLQRVLERFPLRKRPFIETLPEGFSLEELHRDVRDVLVAPEVVNSEDVRVRERRDRPGFSLEARERGRVGGEPLRQDLDRDVAFELGVPRSVDFAHPTCAERREDLVRAEARTRGERHFNPSPRKSWPVTRRTR